MPNYYNPWMNLYPATYPMSYAQNSMPMQQVSYAQQPQRKYMEWVEGEVGAKASPMPNDLPPNQPIPLWDNSDTIIWLKSWNQMGIPNPLQKIRYELPEQPPVLPQGQSGTMQPSNPQPENYVTKDDFNQMKNELVDLIRNQNQHLNQNNQNGNNQNRGGK